MPLRDRGKRTIVVARMGQSTSDSAERLSRLEAPVLGIVANGIKVSRGGKYGYGNCGGYYAEPSEQEQRSSV